LAGPGLEGGGGEEEEEEEEEGEEDAADSYSTLRCRVPLELDRRAALKVDTDSQLEVDLEAAGKEDDFVI